MKKISLILFAILSSLCIHAQRSEGSFTVQPRAGMNISKMTDMNEAKYGYNFGMEVEYQMTDMLSLSAALMYSDQGGVDKVDGIKTILDIDYLNVPIMLNCYVAPEVIPGLAIKAGIQPGFRSKTTVKCDGIKMDLDWLLNQVGEDTKLSKVMFAIPVGVSYEYSNIVLDARYIFGINDLYKGEGTNRNNVFQLTLGYKFDADF